MPAIPPGVRGATITGWGTALPPKVLTNHDLEQMFDTSDEWIVERTGIHERHVGGTTDRAVDRVRAQGARHVGHRSRGDRRARARHHHARPQRSRPARSRSPPSSGLRCGAFDVNAACSGFVYGLVQAHGLIAMGARNVLLIGTDTLARITDWTDRNTAVLFADGSGAVVLEATDGPGQLLGWDLDADGTAERFLYCELGGYIQMEGKEVFRRAVRIMVDSAHEVADARRRRHPTTSRLVVPHQANIRIIQAACERLGVPMERTAVVLDRTGNTSSASIPLALVRRARRAAASTRATWCCSSASAPA